MNYSIKSVAKAGFIPLLVVAVSALSVARPAQGNNQKIGDQKLVGRWVERCKEIANADSDTGALSYSLKLEFGANGILDVRGTLYIGSDCQAGQVIEKTHLMSAYTAIQNKVAMIAAGARTTVIVSDQNLVNEYNRTRRCGADDWKYGAIHEDCAITSTRFLDNSAKYTIDGNKLSISNVNFLRSE